MIDPKRLRSGDKVRNIRSGAVCTFEASDGLIFTATNALGRDVTRYCHEYEPVELPYAPDLDIAGKEIDGDGRV